MSPLRAASTHFVWLKLIGSNPESKVARGRQFHPLGGFKVYKFLLNQLYVDMQQKEMTAHKRKFKKTHEKRKTLKLNEKF